MKAFQLMEEIIGDGYLDKVGGTTVDNCKAGDPNAEVTRVATCMTATPDVIKAAREWGAQLLITHEPTFYAHDDTDDLTELSIKKHDLVAKSGLTIYRWHDSTHYRTIDLVSAEFIRLMGLRGKFDGEFFITLDEPMTVHDIARMVPNKINVKHPRIIGRTDIQVKKIGLFLGHRGNDCYLPFRTNDAELGICGELCEWYNAEPVRDMAQMGMEKALILLGHVGSERFVMDFLAGEINKSHPEIEAKYFDCGELYTYID